VTEETTVKNINNFQCPLLQNEPGEAQDDWDLIEIIALLWNRKWWIVLGTVLITCLGLIYALTAENRYAAQAVFAPREADKNTGAGLLSQMGGLGGMIASQMGIGGTSLDHIVIIAKSHDLAEVIINKYDLLPKLFHKNYDFENKKWTYEDTAEIPSVKKGTKILLQSVVSISSNAKSNIITIKAECYDSVLAKNIVNYYLQELDNRLKEDIVRQSHEKKVYLDEQMRSTEDPWMVQKLQALIGAEVEKTMLISGSALNVLETPMVPTEKLKPKRKMIILGAFFIGLIFSAGICIVVGYLPNFKKHGDKSA